MSETPRPHHIRRPRPVARSAALVPAALALALAACTPGPALDASGILVPPSLPVEVSLYSGWENPHITAPRDVVEEIIGCVGAAERVPSTPGPATFGIPAFVLGADGATVWVHREAILTASADGPDELVEGCADAFPALLEAARGQLLPQEVTQLEEG